MKLTTESENNIAECISTIDRLSNILYYLSVKVTKRQYSLIPNGNSVKSLLQSTILITDNPGFNFISYEATKNNIKSHDLSIILRSLKQLNIPFSKLADYLWSLRDILAHNGMIKAELLIPLTDSLRYYVDYAQQDYVQAGHEHILLCFLKDLIEVYNVILTGNKILFIETQQINVDAISTIQPWNMFKMEGTFVYFKENGWKKRIKGMKIVILDGKNEGQEVIFKSWSGTSVIVSINQKKVGLPLVRNVRIL
jgi:hypothetical protein